MVGLLMLPKTAYNLKMYGRRLTIILKHNNHGIKKSGSDRPRRPHPLGNTALETWENLKKGVSGAGPITHFDASKFKTRVCLRGERL